MKFFGSKVFEKYKISLFNQHGRSSIHEELHATQRNIFYLKYIARTKIITFCTDKNCSNEN